MQYETALDVISTHYGKESKIPQYLSSKAVITLANLCHEGRSRHVTDATLARLSTLDENRQAAWLANPFLQSIIEGVENSYARGTVTSTATPTPAPGTNNKKAEPAKPVEKKKEEVVDDDEGAADLFSIFD